MFVLVAWRSIENEHSFFWHGNSDDRVISDVLSKWADQLIFVLLNEINVILLRIQRYMFSKRKN